MFTKPLKTDFHKRLDILQKRKALTKDQQNLLRHLNNGHEGEKHFFQMLQDHLQCDPIQLYDLHLKVGGSECQIDSLLIFQHEILLFEIKNYQGDFLIDHNKWYKLPKREIKNPLHQLQRTELILKQFLHENNMPLTIQSHLVFINPEFHLYQASQNLPAIFPTQLKRFIYKLKNIPSERHKRHHQFVQSLKNRHVKTSAFESNILYDYQDLKKGITCEKCHGIMEMYNNGQLMHCATCKNIDYANQSILKSINDFRTLFPEQKLTVKQISSWLGSDISDFRIRTVPSNNFKTEGKGKNTHYV